ncbi:isopentenyl-diphosphate delta-isomerase [Mucilaginibacter pedocola]|uniref:Isopentenyl-diphosphate delta-isomerase n=2 Tax=Mucilaginibacter pedocola TaxID=1792845 RepID=A0A1S9P6V4_9SPHI|nr:isopentenyl-diphosphate delta-isomerase [Mucilaginibacter pedocola]
MLVDHDDQRIGVMEKMEAHLKGALHRAFSIFVFNSSGKLLLQQRALEKYHSGGLWTNSCCGHPRPGEDVLDAGKRRLMEETGLTCELEELFTFVYRHEFPNGLTEYEYDHVLIGFSDEAPRPDPAEIADHCYQDPEKLSVALKEQPELYTAWLQICYDRVLETFKQKQGA